ncbi:beta-N-acetylhexosaminidase [Paenibacillus sp. 1_12]|uniref:beta-N-acetylhexosaminidase n=1 Tax=Paenibacillus sp. 1_12 TaxID=1566278 RepID=UPI0008E2E517|nr:beta-N-acetylhexosaminidase [Paenibacillus sp. 1_12]SFL37172.1 beta-N-acetylhexosaminidase [Paenibacillus sp. 1_12]
MTERKILCNVFIILCFLVLCGCMSNKSPVDASPSTVVPPAPDSSPKPTQTDTPSVAVPPPAPSASQPTKQEDKVLVQMKDMSVHEKVGQLVVVGMDGLANSEQTKQLITDYHVGGFIFFKVNLQDSTQTLTLLNSLKATNESVKGIPLMLSVDEEGGRVTRLPDELKKLPANAVIGKKNNSEFSREIGKTIGNELKGYGFNTDFAPVLDVFSNPNNTVIGDRSFGNQADLVSRLGIATMQGIQSDQVVAVVKHFPGHGDTTVDSHLGLPVVNHDLTHLRQLELIPFANAINNGADAVMVAHLLMPKLDADHPASFSKAIISDLLRKEMGFNGVVFTDDLTMGAITQNYDIGQAAVSAVLAGGDVVLVGHSFDQQVKVIQALLNASSNGVIPESVLNASVYRILKLKEKYHMSSLKSTEPDIKGLNASISALLGKYLK